MLRWQPSQESVRSVSVSMRVLFATSSARALFDRQLDKAALIVSSGSTTIARSRVSDTRSLGSLQLNSTFELILELALLVVVLGSLDEEL